jgi:N-acetylmuramoyl-L-alanine amidase
MSNVKRSWRPVLVGAWVLGGSFALTACSPGSTVRATHSSITSAATAPPATTPARATRSPGSTGTVGRPPTVVEPSAPTSTVPGSNAAAVRPLAGKIVAVDPGHNGGNAAAPGIINQIIWNGRESETCDTTGTETDFGYTEAQFNFNVATYLAADLRAEGATVVLTRSSNGGVGPCVTQRAAIGNNAHADAAISIHADGGPPSGRGFAVLEPVSDGINAAIIGPSQELGLDIRRAFLAGTGEPISSYDGVNGMQPRDDLAGLNLSTVPKVLIECANMRNATDAALLTTARWQQAAAQALATGLTAFLTD